MPTAARGFRSLIEWLEPRTFLSQAGYTPAQIQDAYGFNQITNGTGAGQTIAIVDAFNDPAILSDLGTFDSQFGLAAPPQFTILNQSGGKHLPSTNAQWAQEIATDVEWAHAIAPQANVLLVEASSDATTDLITALNFARHVAGVSVVSLSWGGSESSDLNLPESTGQQNIDQYLTTPRGHTGETFVASSGEGKAGGSLQWPAASPDALSVGGTSLTLADTTGTYGSESAWSGTAGGLSKVEAEPAWQRVAQSSGRRSVPDVAYDADPGTGIQIYDSVPYNGVSGWQEGGGTSIGAPQWAALIAIADQLRADSGLTTLNGVTQTLPALYALYSPPGSAGYATYATYFNDITVAGPGDSISPTSGYDLITGLGSPKAAAIVGALVAVPNGSVAVPNLSYAITSSTNSLIAGSHAVVTVRITNTGTANYSGPLTFVLSAVGPGTAMLASYSRRSLILRPQQAISLRIKVLYPLGLATGQYTTQAAITASAESSGDATVNAADAVAVQASVIDLAVSDGSSRTAVVRPGRVSLIVVDVSNLGNVIASGKIDFNLEQVSRDSETPDVGLKSAVYALALLPGRVRRFVLAVKWPQGSDASENAIEMTMTSTTNPADENPVNDSAVIPVASAVT
jgi:hypothetical protein